MATDDQALQKLLEIMARLRDPRGGCPWDLEQDYQSIAPSTIEEAYEVVDAIERGDLQHLREELGDLLFQVVFYAQLGREEGRFSFGDIVDELSDKLLRRHPHVFPDGTLESRVESAELDEAAVKGQWESIKAAERAEKGQASVMADVPAGLPAMTRAAKLQKRAARVGFDWAETPSVLDKLEEEAAELRQALDHDDRQALEDELGDCLFTLVNFARHQKLDPERALRAANRRFTARFQHMEGALSQRGESLEAADAETLEAYWRDAKRKSSDAD